MEEMLSNSNLKLLHRKKLQKKSLLKVLILEGNKIELEDRSTI